MINVVLNAEAKVSMNVSLSSWSLQCPFGRHKTLRVLASRGKVLKKRFRSIICRWLLK
jgi:hypothetical protein